MKRAKETQIANAEIIHRWLLRFLYLKAAFLFSSLFVLPIGNRWKSLCWTRGQEFLSQMAESEWPSPALNPVMLYGHLSISEIITIKKELCILEAIERKWLLFVNIFKFKDLALCTKVFLFVDAQFVLQQQYLIRSIPMF